MRWNIRPRFWGFVIVVMVAAFGVSFAAAQHSLREGSVALASATAQRDDLQLQVERLNDQLQYTGTDEYVIRVARDELGLIMPGEIRYVSSR